jgi:hypothetical protein
MVRVENYKVIRIVDNAMSVAIKVADEVDIRSLGEGTFKPRIAQRDGSVELSFLLLDEQHLPRY